jgi:hypothetical protein
MAYADRRYVSDYFPSQTMLARLTALCTYLSSYGISVDPSNITGPTLEARAYDKVLLSEVLSDTAKMAGDLVWEIKDDLLRMYEQASAPSAPFDLIDGDGNYFGDIQVETERTNYRNRVIVKAGSAKTVEKTDTFTADGTHAGYTLTYTMVYTPYVGRGYVTRIGTEFETLGLSGSGARWLYDPTFNTITRVVPGTTTPAPAANGDSIAITYDAQFPIYVSAFDGAEETANGIWEALIVREDIFDIDEAQAVADAELALGLLTTQTLRYSTRRPGLRPGMAQRIQSSDRNVDVVAIITEIAISTEMPNQSLVYAVTAIASGALLSWQNLDQSASNGSPSLLGGGGSIGGTVSLGKFTGDLPVVDGLPGSSTYGTSDRSGPGATWNRFGESVFGGGHGWSAIIGQDGLARWWGVGNMNIGEWAFKVYANPGGPDFALCPPSGTSKTHTLGLNASSATRWKALYIARGAIFEGGSSVALGSYADVSYASGNFTGSGTITWTVDSGDQSVFRYERRGNTVHFQIAIRASSVSGTGNTLKIALPFTAAAKVDTTCAALDALTEKRAYVSVAASAAIAEFTLASGANWAASTNQTYLFAEFDMPV